MLSNSCPYCEADIVLPDNEFYVTCENCKEGLSLDGSGNIVIEEVSAQREEEEDLDGEVEPRADIEVSESSAIEEDSMGMGIESVKEESLSHLGSKVEGLDESLAEKSFSEEALSLDFNESCLYDLMISGIDSLKTQTSLVNILQDERLHLDTAIIEESFKDNISGRVSFKSLNVFKLSYIVQTIYNDAMPVELYWEQKSS